MQEPEAILDRHDSRRREGIATVGALVGSIDTGEAVLQSRARATGAALLLVRSSEFPAERWLRTAFERIDCAGIAIDRLASRLDRSARELRLALETKSRPERDMFWMTLPPAPDDDVLRVICEASAGGIDRFAEEASERVIDLLVRLAPDHAWPSVGFAAGSPSEVEACGRTASAWALRTPGLECVIAVSAEAWSKYLAQAPESRVKALLREGAVVVPERAHESVERALGEAGLPAGVIAVAALLAQDTACLGAAVAAAGALREPPKNAVEADRARSAAERFLFRMLEAMPETRGRFALNPRLDFHFGPRPAEPDLACLEPRVAIEVDGYHHFRTADDYRRDRRKDWELQRRGFIVLRFLAEDVLVDCGPIRARVVSALGFHANRGES